jgi:hypothetical protein
MGEARQEKEATSTIGTQRRLEPPAWRPPLSSLHKDGSVQVGNRLSVPFLLHREPLFFSVMVSRVQVEALLQVSAEKAIAFGYTPVLLLDRDGDMMETCLTEVFSASLTD